MFEDSNEDDLQECQALGLPGGYIGVKSASMVVRIRFGQGPMVARRKGKNSRIALLGAGLLTLISICFAALGIWRLCQDVGLAGDFVFADGLLSHWQVWMASASISYYAGWRLSRYARLAKETVDHGENEEESRTSAPFAAKV